MGRFGVVVRTLVPVAVFIQCIGCSDPFSGVRNQSIDVEPPVPSSPQEADSEIEQFRERELEELAPLAIAARNIRNSRAILIIHVTAADSRISELTGGIETVYQVTVDKVVASTHFYKTAPSYLVLPGGHLGEVRELSPHHPILSTGQRYWLFYGLETDDSTARGLSSQTILAEQEDFLVSASIRVRTSEILMLASELGRSVPGVSP